ncbi:MAG: hypothetical protein JNK58_08760 [Phycisphaerae bacterium]|nr:hypothetical protein [Phycisphaerae bacterium]
MAKRPGNRPRQGKPTGPPRAARASRSVHKGEARRGRGSRNDRPALLIVLATSTSHLEDAVAVLIDLGIAATVIQTKPLSTVLRDEVPVFAGLASMLPRMPESRLVVSITTMGLADRALRLLSTGLQADGHGLFVATIALRGFFGSPGRS